MLERWKQVVEESANNNDCPLALNSSLIRLFDIPTPHLANAYYEFANFDAIEQCLKKPLVLHYLYVIVNLWSGTSNLLRKRLHKLKCLIKNEISHWTKN